MVALLVSLTWMQWQISLGPESPTRLAVAASDAEKRHFLKVLDTLPVDKEFYTTESVLKAARHTRVLFSLTEADLKYLPCEMHLKRDIKYCIGALSSGLVELKEQKEYGVRHFHAIAHPWIKLAWAAMLFDRGADSEGIVSYLRSAIASREQSDELSLMLGGDFEEFKMRVMEQSSRKNPPGMTGAP